MTKSLSIRLCCALLAIVAPRAEAIPAFARTQQLKCASCHSYYPQLNDFGERFRENGYQVPGQPKDLRATSQFRLPVSIHVAGVYSAHTDYGLSGRRAAVTTAEVLSGGSLAPNLGYCLVYSPYMNETENVMGQSGRLDQGSVVFTDLWGAGFSVRAGRFEPAYDAFSVQRSILTDPIVYSAAYGYSIGDGMEITKQGSGSWRFSLGRAVGVRDDPRQTSLQGYYLRVAKGLGRGEGGSPEQRLGLTCYAGEKTDVFYMGGPLGDQWLLAQRHHTWSVALDASLSRGRSNLALQYIVGRAAIGLPYSEPDLTGGIAQMTYSLSKRRVGYATFDWLNTDALALDQWSVGCRYYPSSNVALHAGSVHWRDRYGFLSAASHDALTAGVDISY